MSSVLQLSEQEVQDAVTTITKSDLSVEDKTLLLSGLYMTNSRVEEAIKILEELISNGSQNLGIHRILGDIYACSKQHQLAQTYYEKVMSFSENNPLCVEQLAAKAGLGEIRAGKNIEMETQQLHQDIENEFTTLASDRQVSAMEAAIRNLSSRDVELADLLTLRATNCSIKVCSHNGEIVRRHSLDSCRTCIM